MKKKKRVLKDKEKTILDCIDKYGGAMTAHEVSKRTGISYVTVKKYINKLVKEGILIGILGEYNDKEKRKK